MPSASDSPLPDKSRVLHALRELVAADLERARKAQLDVHRAATHEEAKPENDKDTRALEQSYLARGLAERVVVLENAAAALAALKLRAFDASTPAALGALVRLAPERGPSANYFIAPAAGGLVFEVDGCAITTVTLDAPLGRALLGTCEGEEVSVQTPQGPRILELELVR